MFGIGTQEILIIALIILLLFGGKKIPELMHGVVKGVKSFKDGMNGLDDPKNEEKKENMTNYSKDLGDKYRKIWLLILNGLKKALIIFMI